MRRHLFTASSIVSFLLFGGTLALWILSHQVRPRHYIWKEWGDVVAATGYLAGIDDGSIELGRASGVRGFVIPAGQSNWYGDSVYHGANWDLPGVHLHHWTDVVIVNGAQLTGSYGKRATLSIGLGWPLIMAGVLPVVWIIGLLKQGTPRKRRIARGLCGECGYNLAANTSGVCPECGTAISVL